MTFNMPQETHCPNCLSEAGPEAAAANNCTNYWHFDQPPSSCDEDAISYGEGLDVDKCLDCGDLYVDGERYRKVDA